MMFLAYAASAFVTYALLSPIYFYEIAFLLKKQKKVNYTFKVLLLCTVKVKALDWGTYMELDAAFGSMVAAIVCAIVFYGFQEWVDQQIKEKNVAFSVKLWKRSFFGITNILDGWIHLALFHYLCAFFPQGDNTLGIHESVYTALASAIGHVAGMLSTYPFVSMRRQNKRYFDGFALYFLRSTAAAFLIPFFASYILSFIE
jgi:hypothetical protein